MPVKKRIIPLLTVIDNFLVKSINFNKLINVGDPIKSAKIFNDSDADELIILNIQRENRNVNSFLNLVENIAKNCFMPLAIGGGVNTFEDSKNLFNSGADRIIINTSIFKNFSLLDEISLNYGKEAIIASLDFKKINNDYYAFSNCGNIKESIKIDNLIEKIDNYVGELFINSIDNDGSMQGMDINLFKYISSFTDTPLIGCGGVGNFNHLRDAFLECNLSGVACGSLFNFGDNNPIRAKNFLTNYDLDFKLINQ